MFKFVKCHLIVLCVLLNGAITPAKAAILFEESFDAPGLPATLDFISNPSINIWSIDGANRLFLDKLALPGGRILAAASKVGFSLTSDGLRYSADMGRPLETTPGGSNIGLVFGDYVALFHPGHAQGAFRLERGLFIRETLVNNLDIGFTPVLGSLHHVEAFITPLGSSIAIEIMISGLGTDSLMHNFTFSFIDNSPTLASGIIGVQRNGANIDDAFFDNVRVEGPDGVSFAVEDPFSTLAQSSSLVPEPNALVLMGLGLATVGFNIRRRRA